MSEEGKAGAPPRPKPSAPGTPPPRPGAAAPAKPPPPVPAAKPPPPVEENPFLPPESSSKIDAGWGALEDATEEATLEPASTNSPWADSEPVPPPAPPPPPPPKVVAAPPPIVEPEPAKPPADDAESKPASEPPPFKKRSRGKVLALVLLPVLFLAGGGFAYKSQMDARARMQVAPTPTPEKTAEPVPTSEPPPPPTYTPEPPPSASAVPAKPAGGGVAPAVSIEPAQRAYLDATGLPPGRKIIVDGRVVGSSPRKVQVRCGVHQVKIGDLDSESINFPCGGEVSFTD